MKIKLFILIGFLAAMTACERESSHEHEDHIVGESTLKYTCPMHPEVIADKPGSCPVCGMDLVKATEVDSQDLMLTDTQIQLANIKVQPVSKREVGESLILNGVLTADESRRTTVSSRAAGRIEKLFVKETGHTVIKGQPLYVLYSETLLTLQREYLMAMEQFAAMGKGEGRYKSMLDAAKRKLLLLGLTKKQISELDRNSIEPRLTIYSPMSGTITAINMKEGQYVNEGTSIFDLQDLSTLWVEAELFASDVHKVQRDSEVTVSVQGQGPVNANVVFVSPQFKTGTQISVLRAVLPNKNGQLKPGQYAQVSYTETPRTAVALPKDAIIRTKKGEHVYVQTARNTFQPRKVQTGNNSGYYEEVLEGINEKDTVVVSGAYLLYSEMVLRLGREPLTAQHHNH